MCAPAGELGYQLYSVVTSVRRTYPHMSSFSRAVPRHSNADPLKLTFCETSVFQRGTADRSRMWNEGFGTCHSVSSVRTWSASDTVYVVASPYRRVRQYSMIPAFQRQLDKAYYYETVSELVDRPAQDPITVLARINNASCLTSNGLMVRRRHHLQCHAVQPAPAPNPP